MSSPVLSLLNPLCPTVEANSRKFSLFTQFPGVGRSQRLGFPEIKALTHLVSMATSDKKEGRYFWIFLGMFGRF